MPKFEGGEGASATDVERGYLEATNKDGVLPAARDPANYKSRYSIGPGDQMFPYAEPYLGPDGKEDPKNAAQFQSRDRRSPGLLERPWPPNDRN